MSTRQTFARVGAVVVVATVFVAIHVGKAAKGPSPRHVAASIGEVPPMMNYQGYLTDAGKTPSQGAFPMTFRIFADSSGGAPIWSESYATVSVMGGVFNVLLGSVSPLALNTFDGSTRWIETEVDGTVMLPRRPLVSVPYSLHAQVADVATVAANTRDTYHEIIDLAPNTAVRTFIAARTAGATVTLYLHGEGFAGTLASHTHVGGNAHDHSFAATTGNASSDHTHAVNATTGGQSNDHAHSGSTSNVDLSHAHSGVVTDAGTHRHQLVVDGAPGSGIYLVVSGNVNGLSASNTADRFLAGSVELDGSHRHGIPSDLGQHGHSFTTGGATAGHTHGLSTTTSGSSTGHTHPVSGVTASTGAGLEPSGVPTGTLPSSVRVYVDGNLVPGVGPFSGQFATGPIDLSALIPDASEHAIEIREEGGSGGRIIYTIHVEYTVSTGGQPLLSGAQGVVVRAEGSGEYFALRVNDAGQLLPPQRLSTGGRIRKEP